MVICKKLSNIQSAKCVFYSHYLWLARICCNSEGQKVAVDVWGVGALEDLDARQNKNDRE